MSIEPQTRCADGTYLEVGELYRQLDGYFISWQLEGEKENFIGLKSAENIMFLGYSTSKRSAVIHKNRFLCKDIVIFFESYTDIVVNSITRVKATHDL